MSPRMLLAASIVCLSVLFLPARASASATPAVVQACSTSSAVISGTSVNCSFTVNVTAGDLVYVAACYYPTVTGSTATDSNGNRYVLINTNNSTQGNIGCTSFYAASVSASPNAKPTITVSNAASTQWWTMVAIEYSGIDQTAPLDQVAAATGDSGTPSSGNLTPTQGGDLMVAAGFIGQGTMTAGTGFRQVMQTGGGCLVEDRVLSGTTPVAATATATQSSNWALQAVAFRAAATGPSPTSGPAPRSNHVAFVLLENRDYRVVEGSASMPYLNSLMSTYAQANTYFGDTHPSIGNYMMLTTGQIITNDDNYTGTVTADNLARQMIAAGRTWKVYAQSLPYAGYLGSTAYPYEKHHNPFAYFSDVINSTAQTLNIVPFTQFPTDLTNAALPNYSLILPDDQHNGHDCPPGMSTCTEAQILANVDNWLQTNIDPLIKNAAFQQDGILVIAWDEAAADDDLFGGGHITYAVVGPGVKRGYASTTFYQHESAERLACDALAIPCPGNGAAAPQQGEFFSSPASSAPSCSLSVSPTSGVAPLGVTATGSCTDSGDDITSTTLNWGDGSTQAGTSGTHTYTTIGTYTVTVTAVDAENLTGSVSKSVSVSSSAPSCTLLVSPSSGGPPLTVTATGACTDAGNDIVTTTLNWGDGTIVQNATSGTHTYNTMGSYTVTVSATDSQNLSGSASRSVSVTAADFSLTVSPTSATVRHGRSVSFTVTVSPTGSFTGTVNLTASNLPTGTTASFSPTGITQSGSSTLKLNTGRNTPPGTYTVIVTGTSGALTHSANITLTVQ